MEQCSSAAAVGEGGGNLCSAWNPLCQHPCKPVSLPVPSATLAALSLEVMQEWAGLCCPVWAGVAVGGGLCPLAAFLAVTHPLHLCIYRVTRRLGPSGERVA